MIYYTLFTNGCQVKISGRCVNILAAFRVCGSPDIALQIRINGIHALNQNQRYEVLMHFQINGIYACRHRPGYEARMGFPGHEPGMNARVAFPGRE